jgi:hypothetical protein
LKFLVGKDAVIVVAQVEVDLLSAACLASELQGVAIGPEGSDDVATPLAKVDTENGCYSCLRLVEFVLLAHFEVAI